MALKGSQTRRGYWRSWMPTRVLPIGRGWYRQRPRNGRLLLERPSRYATALRRLGSQAESDSVAACCPCSRVHCHRGSNQFVQTIQSISGNQMASEHRQMPVRVGRRGATSGRQATSPEVACGDPVSVSRCTYGEPTTALAQVHDLGLEPRMNGPRDSGFPMFSTIGHPSGTNPDDRFPSKRQAQAKAHRCRELAVVTGRLAQQTS